MYQPPQKNQWSGRTDPLDGEDGNRWHHIVNLIDLSLGSPTRQTAKQNVVVLGFCCDEGVRRNSGRVGAKKGPSAIRQALSNLAVHFENEELTLWDAGDVICQGQNMEAAQEMLGLKVCKLLEAGFRPIVLGGGHEVAFGHYLGIDQYAKAREEKVGIINIDAHFDLRRYDKQGSSGTPFLQISGLLNDREHFHYLPIGISELSNTKALFKTAEQLGVQYITDQRFNESSFNKIIEEIDGFINQCDSVYLTIDMDAFNAGESPGVSAPSPNGIDKNKTIQLLKCIITSGKVISMDIAEVNPELDLDNRTAKLAAYFVGTIVKEMSKLNP
ncbi:MAG: formimidoylglutamase [Bacteroidota bacterium]